MALVQSAAPIPSPSRPLTRSSPALARTIQSNTTSAAAAAKVREFSQPVTPSGHQRQKMSFQMSSFTAPPNPYQIPSSYPSADGSQTPIPPQVEARDVSEIYVAVYSSIHVYEMMVNGINVMRRKDDSWLNATQILKVAGIEKGKRTKVLEKEILPGKHEKVQGGYGKYQGTWIEYERGRSFCKQYGVEDVLKPLLEYDMGQDGQSKGTMDTPTKEQAMAAQRKKRLSENRTATQSPNGGTFFQKLSSSAANAVQAMNKARFESPGSRPGSSAQKPRPQLGRSFSQQQRSAVDDSFHNQSSQQSLQSIHSEHSFNANGQLNGGSSFSTTPNPFLSNNASSQQKRSASSMQGSHEPSNKRRRSDSGSHNVYGGGGGGANGFADSQSTLVAEQSSNSTHGMLHTDVMSLPPLPPPTSTSAQRKQAALLNLVMTDENGDVENHATFDEVTGEELDIPMDNTGHTALIWAATLGRISLVRKLVECGANIYRVNVGGETALIRAASAVNNFERGCFPDLLEILGPTLDMRDGRYRTVVHHIAISSAIKGRSRACKYYLESLLEYVVRQGSGSHMEVNGWSGSVSGTQALRQRSIGLSRFMSDIVNAQDVSGDTALNMAARNNNRALAQQLLEVGADASIPNNGGLKPTDFGVEGLGDLSMSQVDGPLPPTSSATGVGAMGPPANKRLGSKVAESGDELLKTMQAIIEDHKSKWTAESRAKQVMIEEAAQELATAKERAQAEEKRLTEMKRRKGQRDDMKSQIVNLRHSNDKTSNEIVRTTQTQPKPNVKIGDADAGLWIDGSLLPARTSAGADAITGTAINGETMDLDDAPNGNGVLSTGKHSIDLASMTNEQSRYARNTLSSSHFLQARLDSYRENNARMEEAVNHYLMRSSNLHAQIMRAVSLSIKVDVDSVPKMLPGLLTAIESENGEVDTARIRTFLRRVEEEESGEASGLHDIPGNSNDGVGVGGGGD